MPRVRSFASAAMQVLTIAGDGGRAAASKTGREEEEDGRAEKFG